MTTINLHQPGVLNSNIDFPTEWNDLLPEDLHAISKAMLGTLAEPNQIKGFIISYMLQRRCKASIERLNAEDVVLHGFPLLDFLFQENNLTKQPYPTLTIHYSPFTRLYGPQDDFNNLTCAEYEDAEIFFHQFREEPGHEPLAHLAAILWRPKRNRYFRYNPRKGKYTGYDAERMVKRFLTLPPWQLYTIFTWYTGCRNQLPKIFPNAFGGEGDGEELDPLAFTKCIHAGAGPKNGSRDQIRCMLLKEYLMDMELEAIKVNEIKAAQ